MFLKKKSKKSINFPKDIAKKLKEYQGDQLFRRYIEEILVAAVKWWPYLKTYLAEGKVTYKTGVFILSDGNRYVTAFRDFVEEHDACFSQFLAGADDSYVDAMAETFRIGEELAAEYADYDYGYRRGYTYYVVTEGKEFTLEEATRDGRAVFRDPDYYRRLLEKALEKPGEA